MYETGIIESPVKVAEVWRAEFDGLVGAGGAFVLTNHPFLTGRPGRAAVLDALIADAVADERVWVCAMDELATHVRGLGLAPRSITRPEPTDS